MHSEIPNNIWTCSEDGKYFQIKEEENMKKMFANDAYLSEWDMIRKEEPKVTREARQMELVAEAHNLGGPVSISCK
jgi:hypothetical protein